MTYDYCDPQIVHGSECRKCLDWYDNDEDLTEDGLCESCADCFEEMEDDDE